MYSARGFRHGDCDGIEAMESRIMFSTFHCNMSALSAGSHLNNYQVTMWATGGKAASYVVHWNDTHSGGSLAITYTAPSGGGPLSVNYQYKGSYTGTITVTATSTTNAVATAYFALNPSYGTFQGVQGTGASTLTPNATAGAVGQTSEVIDNTGDMFNGDTFVAHAYYPTSGSQPLIGITAFDADGKSIGKWGSINGVANNGTYVVPAFGGGTNPFDIPAAIGIAIAPSGDTFIVVAGRCATGWAVCAVDTAANTALVNNYGIPGWNSAANFEAGKATALELDADSGLPPRVAVVGTNNTHMVAAALDLSDGLPWNDGSTPANYYWGSTGIVTIPFSGSYAVSAGANAVIEVDDAFGLGPEELIVGGYTSWCCGTTSASDFTLVSINDANGNVDGSTRTNVGTTLGCSASVDSVYSLVATGSGRGPIYVDAIGQSNGVSGSPMTFAQYNVGSSTGVVGSLVTSFGQYGVGIATGPAGTAYSAVATDVANGGFVVTGSSGGDIITAEFTSSGAAFTGFGNGGVMYQDLGANVVGGTNSTDIGYGVILAEDGTSILVCGATTPSGSSFNQIALVEYLPSNQVTIS
jgi:hypothetical protein